MSRLPALESIERVNASGRGFFVRCDWRDDRYQHTIGLIDGGQRHPILESIEGHTDVDWPPSPPLQQILSQTIDGNPALLAIGMAIGCHWSASFVLHGGKSIGLVVETACLVPEKSASDSRDDQLPRLGTSYTVLGSRSLDEIAPTDDSHLVLPVAALPNSEFGAIRLGGDRIVAVQDRLIVSAKETTSLSQNLGSSTDLQSVRSSGIGSKSATAIRWALRIEAITLTSG